MTPLDPTTNWLRTLIARVAPTHAIELRCTVDGCAAFRLGPLPPEWHADPETGELLCPQHVVDRAMLEPEEPEEPEEESDTQLEDDDAISPPLDTLGPEIAASLDGIDQGTHAPAAVLRETNDPARPGMIDVKPRGRW